MEKMRVDGTYNMYYAYCMDNVEAIYEKVGRDTLMRRLGVSKSAMTNALAAGRFPAAWFQIVRDACRELGADCSEKLFTFKADYAEKNRAGQSSEDAA